MKKTSAKKKYVKKQAPKLRRGNPYNAYVSEHTTGVKGKGGVIFRGLAAAYKIHKDRLGSQKLRMKSDAMVVQRAATNVPTKVRALTASSASSGFQMQESLVACEPSCARSVCDVTQIMADGPYRVRVAIAEMGF